MNSKTTEEVKKRRGKPSSINTYQRLVLLAGAIALILAIWTSPASMPAVGVIGATLLIFFVLKDSTPKQDKGKKIDPGGMLSKSEEKVDLQEMLAESAEKEEAEKTLYE